MLFDELTKYKLNGHFFFEAHQNLEEMCNAPTDKSGVYLIYRLAHGRVELVYIGSSGTKNKDGTLKTRTAGFGGLKDSIVNGKQFGASRKTTVPVAMKLQKTDALDIYWYVTHDENHKDFPHDVESMLLRLINQNIGSIPKWNKKF